MQVKDAITIISIDGAISTEELNMKKELGGIKEINFVQI